MFNNVQFKLYINAHLASLYRGLFYDVLLVNNGVIVQIDPVKMDPNEGFVT